MPSMLGQLRSTLARKLLPQGSTLSDQLLRPLPSIIGLDQLLDYLCATLAELLDVYTPYILLHVPSTERLAGRRGLGAELDQISKLQFHGNDRSTHWLMANGASLDPTAHDDMLRSFPADEQDLLNGSHIKLVVPLVAVNRRGHKRIIGFRWKKSPNRWRRMIESLQTNGV